MWIAIWRDFFPHRMMRKGRCYNIRFSISLGHDGVVAGESKIVRSFASGRKILPVHMRRTHVYERRSRTSSAASPEVGGSFFFCTFLAVAIFVLGWIFWNKVLCFVVVVCGDGSVKGCVHVFARNVQRTLLTFVVMLISAIFKRSEKVYISFRITNEFLFCFRFYVNIYSYYINIYNVHINIYVIIYNYCVLFSSLCHTKKKT